MQFLGLFGRPVPNDILLKGKIGGPAIRDFPGYGRNLQAYGKQNHRIIMTVSALAIKI